jgi:hypothetical protein
MSFYLFTAPLFKMVLPPGRDRFQTAKSEYIRVPDDDCGTKINEALTKWSRENPGFIPYGETKIINNEMIIQLFIKHESKLNDKFLELFLEELKSIPETGTAYNQALENFNELSKRQLGINSNIVEPDQASSSSFAERGGRKRNKTNRKKTRRNKTRRN